MPTAIERARVERRPGTRLASIAEDVSAPGLALRIDWQATPGATDVEVTDAGLTLDAALAEETFPDVPVSSEGNHRVVQVPDGRSVKSIGLSTVLNPGERLTVSLPSLRGGWDAPIFASAGVSNGAMAPQSPQFARFANDLFTLPHAVAAARLRLSKVTGDKVADFSPVPFDPGRVNLTATTPPRNLRVLGPDQAPIWQAPELPDGSPAVQVDLKTPLEIAFRKQIKANAAPSAVITVAADSPGRAFVKMGGVRGALIRQVEGITSIVVDGSPQPLTLASPLASEQPASVTGDLVVRYEGMRILETVSDPVPVPGPIAGAIVGAEPAVRVFPPTALDGIEPARIGLLGRAPEDCEIAVEFVRVVGDSPGPVIGPPAVLTLPTSRDVALHWMNVPAGLRLQGPVGIRARANRGRFFWVQHDDRLATRVAIRDSNPGGRPLRIGSTSVAIAKTVVEQGSFLFPAALFKTTFPVLTSDLFLTVEISDLTLRYAR